MILSRQRLAAVGTPALAIVALAAMTITTPSRRERLALEQATVAEWVQRNAEHLPNTYDSIARFSVTERRIILANLPVEQRARIWKEHLQSFVLLPSKLSPTQQRALESLEKPLSASQRAFIRTFLDSINYVFDPDPTVTLEEHRARAKPFSDRATRLFTPLSAHVIFGTVGPEISVPLLVHPAISREGMLFDGIGMLVRAAAERVHIPLSAPTLGRQCECSTESTVNCIDGQCLQEMGQLCLVIDGCGFAGWFNCDGTCTYL